MIIDLIGPSAIGKSTLLKYLKKNQDFDLISIERSTFASVKGKVSHYPPSSLSLRTVKFALKLLIEGQPSLAKRYVHFSQWEGSALDSLTRLMIRDEGLIKKFFEAIPINLSQRDINFWLNLSEASASFFFPRDCVNPRVFLFLDIEEQLYLERVKSRNPQHPSSQNVLEKYRLNQMCMRNLHNFGVESKLSCRWIELGNLDLSKVTLNSLVGTDPHHKKSE